ncbi:hypothetical protein LEP3755_53720 [Leptolyngbya sp. NIES-3755]|nr:hypothetical protein LEP3755_53720 [Leptolyngbya sp. NIES-3755]
MASISTRNPGATSTQPPGASRLFQIVGVACLISFLLDAIILALPPMLGSAQWRVSFLTQLGNRGVVLLIGFAMLLYAIQGRRLIKQLCTSCFVLGTILIVASGLVIQDGLTLQRQAKDQISSQASQVESRIQSVQTNPQATAKISPEQAQQATQQLTAQAEAAKRNAQSSIFKNTSLSISNLIVSGLALLMLGRCAPYLR